MATVFRETQIRGSLEYPYKIYTSVIPDFFTYFPMHWHDDFEIIWVKEGQLILNVQSNVFHCNTGDIVIIPPKYIHAMKQYRNEYVRYYNIVFKFEALEANEESIISKKYFNQIKDGAVFSELYFPADTETNKKLLPYINVLYETRHKFESSEMKIKAMLYLILDQLTSLITSETENSRNAKKVVSRMKPVFSRIEEAYDQDLSIDEMTQIACLSRSRFMTLFKEFTGLSFVQYLNTFRLEKAKKKILETEESILEISEECGFHNFSYFIRSFKKQYGKTPLSIRKKQ